MARPGAGEAAAGFADAGFVVAGLATTGLEEGLAAGRLAAFFGARVIVLDAPDRAGLARVLEPPERAVFTSVPPSVNGERCPHSPAARKCRTGVAARVA